MERITSKFWIVEDLWRILVKGGLGERWADLVAFASAILLLVVAVWVVDQVFVRFTLAYIKKRSAQTQTKIDDILFESKFFTRLLGLIPLGFILYFDKIIFTGFSDSLVQATDLIIKVVLVVYTLLTIYSLLNAWVIFFQSRPEAHRKSIKGYVQVAKIVLGFIAAILIISILTNKDPSTLFVGLGATAALLTLVFKDTILGFVASIQLSAQDMVSPGDWIEMPSKNADGVVLDINVNSVKVRNWNNTVTMIPIYSLVSESFTNWRAMEQSDGRRFVRTIYINIDTVKLIDEKLLESLQLSPIVASSFDQIYALARRSSPSPDSITNLALMRANIEIFLRSYPKINDELPLYVRYKQEFSDKGIGLEIYAFSFEKEAVDFDIVQRSVVEYIMATMPLFALSLFQSPSGKDFGSLTTLPSETLTP